MGIDLAEFEKKSKQAAEGAQSSFRRGMRRTVHRQVLTTPGFLARLLAFAIDGGIAAVIDVLCLF
jgi:hypothetical protein